MQLPASSRAELAERLMESVEASADATVEQAWIAEAIRRRDDVRAGRTETIQADTVFAEVREMLRR